MSSSPLNHLSLILLLLFSTELSSQVLDDCKFDWSGHNLESIGGLSEFHIQDLKVGKIVWLSSKGLSDFKKRSFRKVRRYESTVTKKMIKEYSGKNNHTLYNANAKYKYGKNREFHEIEKDLFYKEGKLYRETLEPIKFAYCLKVNEEVKNEKYNQDIIMHPFSESQDYRSKYNYHDGTEPFDLELLINQQLEVVSRFYSGCVIKSTKGEYIALYEYRKEPKEYLFEDRKLKKKRKEYVDQYQAIKGITLVDFKGGEASSEDVTNFSITGLLEKGGMVYCTLSDSIKGTEYQYGLDRLLEKAFQYNCIAGRLQEYEKAYEEYLTENFTSQEIDAIRASKVSIGMRENVLYEILGFPFETNLTIIKGLKHKQLVYGRGIYIYTDNGKVSAVQDIESFY